MKFLYRDPWEIWRKGYGTHDKSTFTCHSKVYPRAIPKGVITLPTIIFQGGKLLNLWGCNLRKCLHGGTSPQETMLWHRIFFGSNVVPCLFSSFRTWFLFSFQSWAQPAAPVKSITLRFRNLFNPRTSLTFNKQKIELRFFKIVSLLVRPVFLWLSDSLIRGTLGTLTWKLWIRQDDGHCESFVGPKETNS